MRGRSNNSKIVTISQMCIFNWRFHCRRCCLSLPITSSDDLPFSFGRNVFRAGTWFTCRERWCWILSPAIYMEFILFVSFKKRARVQKFDNFNLNKYRGIIVRWTSRVSCCLRIFDRKVVISPDTKSTGTFSKRPWDNIVKDTSLKQDAFLHQFAGFNDLHRLLVIWIFFVYY